MAMKIAIGGAFFLFVLSLGLIGFFLFFIDPEFLSASGFLLFYAGIFGWIFSVFFLAGMFAGGRKSRSFVRAWPRRAALLALLAVLSLFFEHINIFSVYIFIALIAALVGTEFYLARR